MAQVDPESVVNAPAPPGIGVLVGRTIAALIGIAAVGVIGLWLWQGKQITQQIALIEQDGLPTRPADLTQWYRPVYSSAEHSAQWRETIEQFAATARDAPKPPTERKFPAPGRTWHGLDAARSTVTAHAEILTRLCALAEQGEAGPVNYPLLVEGANLRTPHHQLLRQCASLLALRSAVAAHDGNTDDVVAALHALFALSTTLHGEPGLDAEQLRMSIDDLAINQIERLLPSMAFTDAQLARLAADLGRIDYQADLRQALIGERALGLARFRDPAYVGLGAISWTCRPWQREDQHGYLVLNQKLIDATQLAWPEMLTAMYGELREMAKRGAGHYPLTLSLTMPLEKLLGGLAWGTARARAADAAVAVTRYNLARGQLPETLDDLVPDWLPRVPINPANGAVLGYRSTADGFELLVDGGFNADESADRAARVIFESRRFGNASPPNDPDDKLSVAPPAETTY